MERSEERASKHVKAVRDFFYHLMAYAFVCGLMVILDVRAGTEDNAVLGLDWAYWVILPWGLGVVGHGISVRFDDTAVDRARARRRLPDR